LPSYSAFCSAKSSGRYVTLDEVEQYVAGIASHAETLPDPPAADPIARDPNDDYLIALARAAQADAIVSGDEDLLVLEQIKPPILSPSSLVQTLERESP
jgi:putative PIN family toxin of toxin-antitoxin system